MQKKVIQRSNLSVIRNNREEGRTSPPPPPPPRRDVLLTPRGKAFLPFSALLHGATDKPSSALRVVVAVQWIIAKIIAKCFRFEQIVHECLAWTSGGSACNEKHNIAGEKEGTSARAGKTRHVLEETRQDVLKKTEVRSPPHNTIMTSATLRSKIVSTSYRVPEKKVSNL